MPPAPAPVQGEIRVIACIKLQVVLCCKDHMRA